MSTFPVFASIHTSPGRLLSSPRFGSVNCIHHASRISSFSVFFQMSLYSIISILLETLPSYTWSPMNSFKCSAASFLDKTVPHVLNKGEVRDLIKLYFRQAKYVECWLIFMSSSSAWIFRMVREHGLPWDLQERRRWCPGYIQIQAHNWDTAVIKRDRVPLEFWNYQRYQYRTF